MRSVEGRWGTCWYYGKDEYVGRSVHNYGEFSRAETEKIIELSGGGLSLDIGANIGCITQALEASGREVVAFEPQPEIYKLLRKNVKGECHNLALGAELGNVPMPRVRYGEKGNYGGLGIGMKSELGNILVPMKTLDSFGFMNVTFMKIDVEGFEIQVLRGARNTILINKPIMYIEDDRIDNRMMLRAYIKELGYTYEMHETPLYDENNFFGLKKNIWNKNYVSMNLICKPC